jgi:AcrR family transcriptional regulator
MKKGPAPRGASQRPGSDSAAALPKQHRAPRRRRDRLAETRLRLLNAAADSLYDIGYARTSIGEVVKRAGLTKGAHLHHYQTKEQLLTATIDHLFANVRTRQATIVLEHPSTPEDLENFLQQVARSAFDKSFVALLELWIAARTNPPLLRAFARYEAENSAFRRHRVESGFGSAAVNRTDMPELIEGSIFIMRGLMLQSILEGDWMRNSTWQFWRRRLAEAMFGVLQSASASTS